MNSAAIYSTPAAPDSIEQLQRELAELQAAARAYFAQSDLVALTRSGVEAADRLNQLLNRADAA